MKIFCCDVWGKYSTDGRSEWLETFQETNEETMKAKAAEYIADFEDVSWRSAWIDREYTIEF